MNKLREMGPLFVVIAALLWSFDALLRASLYSLPPAVVVFWEHILGALILTVVFFPRLKEVRKLTRKEWYSIVFVGLFSGALGTILYTAALGKINFIQFSVVPLLQQLQPVWTTIAAALLLKERITPRFVKWAVVALTASYFVTFPNGVVNLATGSGTVVAAGFALLAGIMWGTSTAFSKVVLNKVSFGIGTLLRFWVAGGFAFAFVLLFRQQGSLLAITVPQWYSLLAITLSTGMVALLIYYYGLKRTPARVAEICELAWPASAIFIGYYHFQQALTASQVAAVLVLVYAMYQVSRFRK